MPSNKEISEEEEALYEKGGGVKQKTKKERETSFVEYQKYAESKLGKSIPEQYAEDPEILSKNFSSYFWTMTVRVSEKGDNGLFEKVDRKPKAGYAHKIKSHIRMEVIERYQIDLTDPLKFPNFKRRWQSFVESLANEGLCQTTHYEEISAETVHKLFNLFNNLKDVLSSRGNDDYNEKLAKIPAKFHNRLNFLLQYMAQFLLTMFECRRGTENLESLRKKDFKMINDQLFDFSYWKKVISEKDKNHREGTNVQEAGVIPCKTLGIINPGELFGFYLELVPDNGTIPGKGGYLFPKPRDPTTGFNIHSPSEMDLFQPNQSVGKNMIAKMLPTLCEAVDAPRGTNHMVRVTAIKYMRRSGFDWLTIAKISGHKNLCNLIKNYDLNMEGRGLANVAAAIVTGPSVAAGDSFEEVTLERRKKLGDKSSNNSSGRTPIVNSKIQPSFPANLSEEISSRPRKAARKETANEECNFDLEIEDSVVEVQNERSKPEEGPVRESELTNVECDFTLEVDEETVENERVEILKEGGGRSVNDQSAAQENNKTLGNIDKSNMGAGSRNPISGQGDKRQQISVRSSSSSSFEETSRQDWQQRHPVNHPQPLYPPQNPQLPPYALPQNQTCYLSPQYPPPPFLPSGLWPQYPHLVPYALPQNQTGIPTPQYLPPPFQPSGLPTAPYYQHPLTPSPTSQPPWPNHLSFPQFNAAIPLPQFMPGLVPFSSLVTQPPVGSGLNQQQSSPWSHGPPSQIQARGMMGVEVNKDGNSNFKVVTEEKKVVKSYEVRDLSGNGSSRTSGTKMSSVDWSRK